MLTNIKLEEIGEFLRANIRYDLDFAIDDYDFFKIRNSKDKELKQKIDLALNRKITSDDKL